MLNFNYYFCKNTRKSNSKDKTVPHKIKFDFQNYLQDNFVSE